MPHWQAAQYVLRDNGEIELLEAVPDIPESLQECGVVDVKTFMLPFVHESFLQQMRVATFGGFSQCQLNFRCVGLAQAGEIPCI